jgi:predicted enzyme involved in methoxymalonyl-ACP biosynthesis
MKTLQEKDKKIKLNWNSAMQWIKAICDHTQINQDFFTCIKDNVIQLRENTQLCRYTIQN